MFIVGLNSIKISILLSPKDSVYHTNKLISRKLLRSCELIGVFLGCLIHLNATY